MGLNNNGTHNAPISVTVCAPARLHLGFVDLHGGLGRRFGSLGLTLQQPCTELIINKADTCSHSGPDSERGIQYARHLLQHYQLNGAINLTVRQAIPKHAGLGSGTQLALAVAVGLKHLFQLSSDAQTLARQLQRGARSGIGIAAFLHGGFLVDGGRGILDQPPPLISRLPVPEQWRLLLIFDHQRQGINGSAEKHAFAKLPPFSEQQAENLCRLLVMQALPALAEQNIDAFGEAITLIQKTIGEYFAPQQGGRFSSPAVAEVLNYLATQADVAAVGQSSWGPTGFALLADKSKAEYWQQKLQQRYAQRQELSFSICQPRNQPGQIRLTPPSEQ